MNMVQKLSDNTKEFLENFFEILDEMESDMSNVELTDSISEIFIRQLIPHHRAGIKISENILDFTTNPLVETLAKSLIQKLSTEIDKMESMLEACRGVKNQRYDIKLYNMEYTQVYNSMILKMRNSQTGNNLNIDFLSQIIPHHEGGVNMARNVLRFDICPQLRNLAENIVSNESLQLKEMRDLNKSLQIQSYRY